VTRCSKMEFVVVLSDETKHINLFKYDI